MSSLDDTPCASLFPKESSTLDPLQRRNDTIAALQKVVKKLVDVAVPSTASEGKPQNQQTQNVSQKYKRNKGKEAPEKKANEDDTVLEYARDILSLGLLYMEFMDAIRVGDGSRILRCWRYLLFIFRAAHRTNYALEAFTLLAQEKFILSSNGTQVE